MLHHLVLASPYPGMIAPLTAPHSSGPCAGVPSGSSRPAAARPHPPPSLPPHPFLCRSAPSTSTGLRVASCAASGGGGSQRQNRQPKKGREKKRTFFETILKKNSKIRPKRNPFFVLMPQTAKISRLRPLLVVPDPTGGPRGLVRQDHRWPGLGPGSWSSNFSPFSH